MTKEDWNNLTENFSIRLSKRDPALLEQISNARGCSNSDFVRSFLRASFRKLAYLKEEEKKAMGNTCPLCGGTLEEG